MLCKLVQSIKGARKQFFSPRKRVRSELHIFFKEFQVPSLCTVTHVLVSHVLPQLQLLRTHTEQNPQQLLALKKSRCYQNINRKIPKHSAKRRMWSLGMWNEREENWTLLLSKSKRLSNPTQKFKIQDLHSLQIKYCLGKCNQVLNQRTWVFLIHLYGGLILNYFLFWT